MKTKLIDNQIVLTLPPRRSWLVEVVCLVSNVAFAMIVIAMISMVTILVYETHYPRQRIDITMDVVKKACGVAI